jgi:hypothetical protein
MPVRFVGRSPIAVHGTLSINWRLMSRMQSLDCLKNRTPSPPHHGDIRGRFYSYAVRAVDVVVVD